MDEKGYWFFYNSFFFFSIPVTSRTISRELSTLQCRFSPSFLRLVRDDSGNRLVPTNHTVKVGAGESIQLCATLVDSFGYTVHTLFATDGQIDSALIGEKTRAIVLWISLDKSVRTGFENEA